MSTRNPTRTRRSQRQSGAAMLVVMLMMLVGTTLAAITVHTITLEMRSAGYYRQQAQTHYVAEAALAGVMALPPDNIGRQVERLLLPGVVIPPAPVDLNDPNLITNYGEPDPALVGGTGRPVLRIGPDAINSSFVGAGGGPVIAVDPADSSIGPLQAFVPWFVVDLADIVDDQSGSPGQNLSGTASDVYLIARVAVRGRTLLDDGSGAPAVNRGASSTVTAPIYQQFTDAAYDMRAVVRIGPVRR